LMKTWTTTLSTQPRQCRSGLRGSAKKNGRTSPIYRCVKACSVIPKKTQGCNHCQMCFNKVLIKGSEYLCKYDISVIFY
jgi:hypothetical protein